MTGFCCDYSEGDYAESEPGTCRSRKLCVDRRVAVVALRSAQHTLAMSSTSFENLPKIYWLTFYVVNGT